MLDLMDMFQTKKKYSQPIIYLSKSNLEIVLGNCIYLSGLVRNSINIPCANSCSYRDW